MSSKKREGQGQSGRSDLGGRSKKRKFYAEAAKSGYHSSEIRGPGLWITCERRKEAKSVTEAYDLLNEIADKLYPETAASVSGATNGNNGDGDGGEDIEAQIARELDGMQAKGPNKKKLRFMSVKTNTECRKPILCLVWISCLPPCDPVVLAAGIVAELLAGGATRSKYLQRMTPVSATGHADVNSLRALAYKVLQSTFAPRHYTEDQREGDPPITYRVEPFLRNHSATLNRDIVTQLIGDVVRDLTNPAFQFPLHQPESTSATDSQDSAHRTNQKTPQAEPSEESSLEKEEIRISEDVTVEGQSPSSELHRSSSIAATGSTGPPEDVVRPPREPFPNVRRRTHVDLKHPSHVILVSALKGVCGISIVEGYEEGRKYNIQVLGERRASMQQQKEATSEIVKGDMSVEVADQILGHAVAKEEAVNARSYTE
ncbi:MAG: hypothetical protein CYPHOPRED_001073 [Cyphobasidiales sp. Tagirdzhanova-0007]|nr:MAG: hypothetical protein CYPHOPRED_001073 [Cyphobasidiales sp. Tagirdzhanova-0007]